VVDEIVWQNDECLRYNPAAFDFAVSATPAIA
jgi:hypothetical protein